MKRFLFIPAILAGISLAQDAEPPVVVAKAIPVSTEPPTPANKAAAAEPEKSDDSPVPLPQLEHYSRLWTESLFTTRAMPMPDAPAGPTFSDNFTLSGTFEENGKLTAVLIDKTTSGIVQAYIGVDNEEGFRISKIEPGANSDQMRIQLQKGNQVGWVTFSDGGASTGNSAPAAAPPPDGILATRPGSNMPQAPQQPTLFPQGSAVPPAPNIPMPSASPDAPIGTAVAPGYIAPTPPPTLRGGLPSAPPALPGDPPLPPP